MHTPITWFKNTCKYLEMIFFEKTALVLGVSVAPQIALVLSGAGQWAAGTCRQWIQLPRADLYILPQSKS